MNLEEYGLMFAKLVMVGDTINVTGEDVRVTSKTLVSKQRVALALGQDGLMVLQETDVVTVRVA